MPTPAGAGMIAAVIHAAPNPIQDIRLSVLWLVLIVVLGVLMSSTIRHTSFKDVQWTRRWPSLAVVAIVAIVGAIVLFSQITLLVIASLYTAHGVVFQLAKTVRHRMASRHA
jgi:phosphatidylserine synthase